MTLQAFDIAIDIGDAQANIDYGALAESPIVNVFIKATQGATFTSPTFGAQLNGCLKAKKLVIPYLWPMPGPPEPQIARFRSVTALAKGQPFAIDWEGRASSAASVATVEAIGAELGAVAGRVPVGYFGIPGSTPAPPAPAMLAWDHWEPRYPLSGDTAWADLPAAIEAGWAKEWPGSPLFAQYTCWGQVPGIKGAVDRSVIFANNLDEVTAWYATGARPA